MKWSGGVGKREEGGEGGWRRGGKEGRREEIEGGIGKGGEREGEVDEQKERGERKGQLSNACCEQIIESITGWTWSAHADSWSAQHDALRLWLADHAGAWPSRSGSTTEERELARWMNNQRVAHQTGQLSTRPLYTSPSPRDRTRSRMPSSA